MTRVFLPALLFLISAFLSVMSLQAAWVSGIVGLALCAYAFVRQHNAGFANGSSAHSSLAASGSMRAGLALIAAPVVTVLLVVAAMSGWFGRT